MPRLPADSRIGLKTRSGPTHRIELVRQPVGRRFPPDLRAEAVKLVLEQAEALCAEWAA